MNMRNFAPPSYFIWCQMITSIFVNEKEYIKKHDLSSDVTQFGNWDTSMMVINYALNRMFNDIVFEIVQCN